MDKYSKAVEKEPDHAPTLNEFKDDFNEMISRDRMEFGADWFLRLVEPHKTEEAPKMTFGHDGKSHWSWSYPTRVINLYRRFKKQDIDFRQYIIKARKEKIYWRGDKPKFFKEIVEETHRMREMGVKKYREESWKKMRVFLKT